MAGNAHNALRGRLQQQPPLVRARGPGTAQVLSVCGTAAATAGGELGEHSENKLTGTVVKREKFYWLLLGGRISN